MPAPATDVPGVFQTPFQSAPLDLNTDAFFPARAATIEARLNDIALGGAGAGQIAAPLTCHCLGV